MKGISRYEEITAELVPSAYQRKVLEQQNSTIDNNMFDVEA